MWFKVKVLEGLGKNSPVGPRRLVEFHEGGDGFLAALGAYFQVVSVVGQRLFAPLATSDSRGLHLRDFFEQ